MKRYLGQLLVEEVLDTDQEVPALGKYQYEQAFTMRQSHKCHMSSATTSKLSYNSVKNILCN